MLSPLSARIAARAGAAAHAAFSPRTAPSFVLQESILNAVQIREEGREKAKNEDAAQDILIDGKKHLLVAITTDRGLCGAVNSSLSRSVRKEVNAAAKAGAPVKIFVLGDKGRAQIAREYLPVMTKAIDTYLGASCVGRPWSCAACAAPYYQRAPLVFVGGLVLRAGLERRYVFVSSWLACRSRHHVRPGVLHCISDLRPGLRSVDALLQPLRKPGACWRLQQLLLPACAVQPVFCDRCCCTVYDCRPTRFSYCAGPLYPHVQEAAPVFGPTRRRLAVSVEGIRGENCMVDLCVFVYRQQ